MFVDYLTVMLLNMVAALVMFALWMAFSYEKNPKKYVVGFLLTGLIALVTGFHMILTWPLPGSNNILFGDVTVLFGALFFFAGLALQFGWDLFPLGIFAVLSGAVAVVLGIRILNMGLGKAPLLGAAGYVIAGVAGILTLPAIALPKMKWIRWLAALARIGAAIIWAVTAYPSYWQHIDSFSKWAPK